MGLAISLSKPDCQEKCGNVNIPYPFGIESKCSANSSFTIICEGNSTNPPTPWLSSMNVEVLTISLLGIITVKQRVPQMKCSNVQTVGSLPISFKGTPFTISASYNSLVVLGCKNTVWLRANETTVGGCTAICDANSTDTSCNGVNCCQTTIPIPLKEFKYTYKTTEARDNNSLCGYVFPADNKWLKTDFKRFEGVFEIRQIHWTKTLRRWCLSGNSVNSKVIVMVFAYILMIIVSHVLIILAAEMSILIKFVDKSSIKISATYILLNIPAKYL